MSELLKALLLPEPMIIYVFDAGGSPRFRFIRDLIALTLLWGFPAAGVAIIVGIAGGPVWLVLVVAFIVFLAMRLLWAVMDAEDVDEVSQ